MSDCSAVHVSAATSGDESRLVDLASRFEWSTRGALNATGDGVVSATMVRALLGSLRSGESLVADSAGSTATASLTHDRWVSDQIGLKFGRIGPLVSDGDLPERRVAVQAILRSCVEVAIETGYELVGLRLRTDDLAVGAALECGFTLVGMENVHVRAHDAAPGSVAATGVPGRAGLDGLEVAIVDAAQVPSIGHTDRTALIGRARTFKLSHFGSNPMISDSAVGAIYETWTANVLDGKYGELVALATFRDQVVGFFAWKRDVDLARVHEIDLVNQSWGVVSMEHRGVLNAMTAAVLRRDGGAIRWIECETQVDNVAMNRAMNRLGPKASVQCAVLHHAMSGR